ncbi:MAG TPA: glycosyltransferase, partial [Gemmatimonadales bacterium]
APTSRVRILEVDAGREWRGGQNQVRLLCRELAGRPGVELRLITRRDGELARRAAAAGVFVHEVPWTFGIDPRAMVRTAALIRSFMPDVVHVHDSHAFSVVRFALASVITKDRNSWLPYLRWFRMNAPLPALVASRRVDFHVTRRSNWFRADRVIAVSEAVKRVLIADGLPERDIVVVHDGIDPAEVRAAADAAPGIRGRLGLPAGVPLAVNVAALVDHKDQRTLIRAAAAARALAPALHWVIAGAGPLHAALAAEAARLGIADRVHLVGFVDGVDALIREAGVFVMSSKEEGMGSVVLHAAALERPVVATAAGGLAEIVPPAWQVPVGDADALARKVASALTHPSPVPLPPDCTAAAMADRVLAQYRLLA